jgi:hypothetical protein
MAGSAGSASGTSMEFLAPEGAQKKAGIPVEAGEFWLATEPGLKTKQRAKFYPVVETGKRWDWRQRKALYKQGIN